MVCMPATRMIHFSCPDCDLVAEGVDNDAFRTALDHHMIDQHLSLVPRTGVTTWTIERLTDAEGSGREWEEKAQASTMV